VQVGDFVVEGDVDEVAAYFEVLDVQGLVDVADEMDDPLQCLLLLDETDGFGDGAGRVVGDGRDDAALLGAIALVVYVALLGGRVEGVDVVEGRTELSASGVAVAVSLCIVSVLFMSCYDGIRTQVATLAR
jgi:hypothetical protein